MTHRREERMVPMYGANVIIFEGIFAFHDKKVVDLLDMKVGFCLDKEMCSVFFIVSEVQFCTTEHPQFCEFELASCTACRLRSKKAILEVATSNLQK